MLINEKINLKKYLIYSIPLLVAIYLLSKTRDELLAMLLIYIAAYVNQLLLVKSVVGMTRVAAAGEVPPTGGKMMFFLAIGKFLLIVAALSFGIHIMGNRVIIPVLIYVLQIAVLYLSLK